MPLRERLIVALDVSSIAQAQAVVSSLSDIVEIYKVGMQLFTAEGPPIARNLIASGKKVFLDLKFHDIPNTVEAAVREAAQLGVSMLTVHAAGGSKMLRAATAAAREESDDLQVLAVTVLTSMVENDLAEVGIPSSVSDQVVTLASTALASGCGGVVSSASELKTLRQKLGHEFLAITPGVRPAGMAHGDQARVVTPAEAVRAGATHIVVGRPITAAANPRSAAERIFDEIEAATELNPTFK
jgi:orotidine-5'-phosphate decarboxylase